MLRTDDIVFPVWDAAASLAFYGETLRLPLIGAVTGDDWGGKAWLMMAFALADGRELVLVALRGAQRPPPDGLPADVRHYAFAVETDAERDQWRDRLAAAQVEWWEEDHGAQRSLYFPDPNGVILEITAPPSSAAGHASPDALAKAKAWIAAAASPALTA